METVKSADGTLIAYEQAGDGPALIVAVGAFCDRQTFVPSAALTSRFTVYTYDRRGRGDSGDTQPYSPEREVEDLAAVVSATSAGGPVFMYGHSSGGALVLRAAAAGVPLAAVASYEAPFVVPGTRAEPKDPANRIRELVAAGRRGDAVRYWMTDVVNVPPERLAMMEGSPAWPKLAALTHTLPYDIALTSEPGIPAWVSDIEVPVLVLGGGTSPDWFGRTVRDTAAAIPGASLVTVDGYDHNVPGEVLAPVLTEFFLG